MKSPAIVQMPYRSWTWIVTSNTNPFPNRYSVSWHPYKYKGEMATSSIFGYPVNISDKYTGYKKQIRYACWLSNVADLYIDVCIYIYIYTKRQFIRLRNGRWVTRDLLIFITFACCFSRTWTSRSWFLCTRNCTICCGWMLFLMFKCVIGFLDDNSIIMARS